MPHVPTSPRAGRAAAAWRIALLGVWCAFLACLSHGCGNGSVRSPFHVDAGSEAGAAGGYGDDGGLNLGNDAGDPTLGGPCADDAQCHDTLPCTSDACDPGLQRCRHLPDDTVCADKVYCNGEEVCDPKLGCVAGAPVSCGDADPCTIDTCVEEDHSCARAPRDADSDGDPVWVCPGGGDCDDTDPSVSSKSAEICGNKRDDNCDGQADEDACIRPAHDTCDDALIIQQSGSSSLSLIGAKLDYPTTCAPAGKRLSDVVVGLEVPPGPPQDVDIIAHLEFSLSSKEVRLPKLLQREAVVSLATTLVCGQASNVQCSMSIDQSDAAPLVLQRSATSRFHLYSVPAGIYTLYVAGTAGVDVALAVNFSAASAPPSNETCGTATPIIASVTETVSLLGTSRDLNSACVSLAGDLVYTFTLQQPRDVTVVASPFGDNATPQLSLRSSHCKALDDELTCRGGAAGEKLFARALPAGTYFLSVGASAPGDVAVRLEDSAPTSSPLDEGCAAPAELTPGVSVDATLADHADAVDLGCLAGAPDSSRALTLQRASDVLLVERLTDGDTGAVSLALPTCAKATRLACGTGSTSPVRSRAYRVAPGEYRVVAESASGNPVTLTAFTRNAVPVSLVALADDCSAPFEIPASGGRFQGNTVNAHADFSAGCDIGNQAKNGAPDQMLHLKLEGKSRVVFDMSGSNYATLLSVRGGAACPGTELQLACAAGYQAERSFLDLDLDSGDYYVQIDGYAGDQGAWLLDVYVTPDST